MSGRRHRSGAKHRQALLRTMLLIRRFEESCAELYSAAKIRGFLHLYIGEEAVAAGVMSALAPGGRRRGDLPRARPRAGARRPAGRDHGRDVRPARPAAAGAAAARCTCSTRPRRFYGGNAIVAGGLPLAVGLALADQMQGRDRVTACFFGDGAVAEGEFHESLNLAALWQLPVLFCCENNLYAMGTALARTETRRPTWRCKAAALRMPAWAVDGMDVLAVEDAAAPRRGGGPRRRRAALPRAAHLPVPRALDVRPGPLPRQGRDRAVEASATRSRLLAALMRRSGQLDDDELAATARTRSPTRDRPPAVEFAEAGAAGAGRGPAPRFVYASRRPRR